MYSRKICSIYIPVDGIGTGGVELVLPVAVAATAVLVGNMSTGAPQLGHSNAKKPQRNPHGVREASLSVETPSPYDDATENKRELHNRALGCTSVWRDLL